MYQLDAEGVPNGCPNAKLLFLSNSQATKMDLGNVETFLTAFGVRTVVRQTESHANQLYFPYPLPWSPKYAPAMAAPRAAIEPRVPATIA